MAPFRLWVDTSMKAMLIVIANEPLCHSEAVGDNQPLLRVVSLHMKMWPLPLCTPILALSGHQIAHKCKDVFAKTPGEATATASLGQLS